MTPSAAIEIRRKRSEAETRTDCRSEVAVVEIRGAGAVRNGDGQTAGDVGIRKSEKSVKALGEVMVGIERALVEGAGAGSTEISGCAGLRNAEVILPLLIPG